MPLHVSLVIPNCSETPFTISIHGFDLRAQEMNLISDNPLGFPAPGGIGYLHTYNIMYDSPTLVKIGNIYPPFDNRVYSIGFQYKPGIYAAYLECPPVDISGLYFINPTKLTKRDNYYGTEKKIPNPTIRTAYFGE